MRKLENWKPDKNIKISSKNLSELFGDYRERQKQDLTRSFKRTI